jgi:hypothetical protein
MPRKPKFDLSKIISQLKIEADQTVWILLGVVGFFLLVATMYVLAYS